MFRAIWHTILYQPLYNVLVFFVSILPSHSLAVSIIFLTIVVKIILLPFTKKSIMSQRALKAIEPDLAKIRATVKDKQEQARQTMALYREKKVNPFSGCLVVLIQFPIIIALYLVITKGFAGGSFDASIIYSFIKTPELVNTSLFGTSFSVTGKNVLLAILVAASQFFVLWQLKPKKNKGEEKKGKDEKDTPKDNQAIFAESLNKNMTYTLPLVIGIVSYQTSAAVALYFLTSNIVSVIQQWAILRKYKNE